MVDTVLKSAPGPTEVAAGIPGTRPPTPPAQSASVEETDLQSWKNKFFGANPEYKLTAKGSLWYVGDINGEEVLGYVDKLGNITFVNLTDYVKKITADAASSKTTESLRASLYQKGYLSKTQYDSKDAAAFNNAIADAGRSFTVNTVQNFITNPIPSNTKVLQLNKWLGTKPTTVKADDGKGTATYLSTKEQAAQEIDEFFMDLLGETATDVEKEEYYNLLIAEQKKAKTTTTIDAAGNKVVTGEPLNEMDLYRIRAKVMEKRLANTPLENLAKGNGRIAQDVTELKEYAASYGVKLDTKQAYDQVMSGMKPGGTLTTGKLDAQKQAIKNMSKAFYTNLSGLIDSGVKPGDIANQFAYFKGALLETPDNTFNIFDEDIQDALRNNGKEGVMSISEYQTLLRTNPKTKQKWLETKGAREDASNYALSILRSFGLMA